MSWLYKDKFREKREASRSNRRNRESAALLLRIYIYTYTHREEKRERVFLILLPLFRMIPRRENLANGRGNWRQKLRERPALNLSRAQTCKIESRYIDYCSSSSSSSSRDGKRKESLLDSRRCKNLRGNKKTRERERERAAIYRYVAAYIPSSALLVYFKNSKRISSTPPRAAQGKTQRERGRERRGLY